MKRQLVFRFAGDGVAAPRTLTFNEGLHCPSHRAQHNSSAENPADTRVLNRFFRQRTLEACVERGGRPYPPQRVATNLDSKFKGINSKTKGHRKLISGTLEALGRPTLEHTLLERP